MGSSEHEALQRLLGELASEDAKAVLDEARAEARSRVRTLLADALSQSLLDAVRARLEPVATEPPHGEPTTTPAAAEPVRSRPAAPAAPEGSTAVYVYGVTKAGAVPVQELPAGIEGDAVRAITEGELAALVSEVALADFDEERLRDHLADMTWVERTARRHEQVLEAIGALGTVIPMRMCTVYESEEGIRALLRREEEALTEALGYLDGKAEWGIKVFCDSSTALAGQSVQAEPETESSGAAYMQRRLHEREERASAMQQLEEATSAIHERLCAAADDALIIPAQRPQASGRSAEMVLNGVYLVGDAQQRSFHAEARALAEQFGPLGLELETTGPWPAYNFVPGTIGATW